MYQIHVSLLMNVKIYIEIHFVNVQQVMMVPYILHGLYVLNVVFNHFGETSLPIDAREAHIWDACVMIQERRLNNNNDNVPSQNNTIEESTAIRYVEQYHKNKNSNNNNSNKSIIPIQNEQKKRSHHILENSKN